MKLIRLMNNIFLHDEDERGYLVDYVWFYGHIMFMITVGSLVLYKF